MASLPSRIDALIPELFLCPTSLIGLSSWGCSYQLYSPGWGLTTISLSLEYSISSASMRSAGPIRAMEQVVGVEPTPSAWKAPILAAIRYLHFFLSFLLHIYYIIFLKENQILGWKVGLEPTASRVTIWRSANWATNNILLTFYFCYEKCRKTHWSNIRESNSWLILGKDSFYH